MTTVADINFPYRFQEVPLKVVAPINCALATMFRVCREIPINYKQVLIQVVPATRLEPCQTLFKK